MDLLVAFDDYCLTKVIVTASVAGVKINVIKGVLQAELIAYDNAAKSMLLKTSSGVISQHVSMLRYIAEMTPAVQLMGATDYDASQVDQWLEFSWCELGMFYCVIRRMFFSLIPSYRNISKQFPMKYLTDTIPYNVLQIKTPNSS